MACHCVLFASQLPPGLPELWSQKPYLVIFVINREHLHLHPKHIIPYNSEPQCLLRINMLLTAQVTSFIIRDIIL